MKWGMVTNREGPGWEEDVGQTVGVTMILVFMVMMMMHS